MNNKKWIAIFTLLVLALIAEVAFTIVHEHRIVVARYERRVAIADELANLDQSCVSDSVDAEAVINYVARDDSMVTMRVTDFIARSSACRETINRVVDLIDSLDNRK